MLRRTYNNVETEMTEEKDAGAIHEERIEAGDAEATYQANKQANQPLNPEMEQALFNPDGSLPQVEVEARVTAHINDQAQSDLVLQAHALERGYFPFEESGFSPEDGPALLAETQAKIGVFESQPGFQAQTNRPTTMRAGVDPSTGAHRMTDPGETVNEGGLIEMVDPAYAAQAAERMRNVSDIDARQSMRRQSAFKTLAQVVLNPVLDPTGVQIIHLDDEQFANLSLEYKEAKAAGLSDDQIEWLPMSSYAHKIWAEGREPLRPKLSNECGWFNTTVGPARTRGKISCLKSSTLTFRTAVQVPRAPEPAPIPAPERPPAPEGAILDKSGNPILNQTVTQSVNKPRTRHQAATQQPPQQDYVSVDQTAPSSTFPSSISQPSSQPSVDPYQIPGLPPPPPGRNR